MSSRRQFLKLAGMGAAGLILPEIQIAKGNSLSLNTLDSSDEGYWSAVRGQFSMAPEFIYFNNGTMGPSPISVQTELLNSLQDIDRTCRYGGGEVGREKLAELVNAQVEEISLTHNTTEGINIVAWGLPLKRKDEVIMTTHEHVGNALPWLNRAKLDGIVVRAFEPGKTGNEVLNQIENAITKRTRVIAVPHITCTTGQLFPVKEIAKLARSKGIWLMVDGAHGPGSLTVDVKDIDADFYVSCCHKWILGPKGTGFVYVRSEVQDILTPIFAGAYTDNGWDLESEPPAIIGYNPTAHRYDYGTQNAALYKGVAAAVDFHLQIGVGNVEKRVKQLNQYTFTELSKLSDIEILNSYDPCDRAGMLAFKHARLDFKTIADKALHHNIRLRQVPEAGLHCIRLSTHIYNTPGQIDTMVEWIKSLS